VYVAGNDSNGCCGGVKSTDRPLLLPFPVGYYPIKTSCGYDDTTILTTSGHAFGCGCSSTGTAASDAGKLFPI